MKAKNWNAGAIKMMTLLEDDESGSAALDCTNDPLSIGN